MSAASRQRRLTHARLLPSVEALPSGDDPEAPPLSITDSLMEPSNHSGSFTHLQQLFWASLSNHISPHTLESNQALKNIMHSVQEHPYPEEESV